MKTTKNILLTSITGLVLGWSAASYSACTPAQVSGDWEMAFSDGNSCKLRLVGQGVVRVENSICFDPDRGVTEPESGVIKVNDECFAEGTLVVEGVTIDLPVQFSTDRTTAAGRYRVEADGSKGSVVMIRVP